MIETANNTVNELLMLSSSYVQIMVEGLQGGILFSEMMELSAT